MVMTLMITMLILEPMIPLVVMLSSMQDGDAHQILFFPDSKHKSRPRSEGWTVQFGCRHCPKVLEWSTLEVV